MKILESGKTLIGGFVVYVAMAACSAAGPGAISGGGSGATGHGGGDGNATGTGGYDAGDIWDALTDPVPNASADPVSGSRLKAKYRLADDGSKEYIAGNWYDSQRQEDCGFQPSADGTQRCLPTATGLQPYYIDAACSQQLAQVYNNPACSAQVPKYASIYGYTQDTCAYFVHVYSVGPQVTPADVYLLNGANCLKTAPSAIYTYYSLGAEIPPTSFVGSTVMHD